MRNFSAIVREVLHGLRCNKVINDRALGRMTRCTLCAYQISILAGCFRRSGWRSALEITMRSHGPNNCAITCLACVAQVVSHNITTTPSDEPLAASRAVYSTNPTQRNHCPRYCTRQPSAHEAVASEVRKNWAFEACNFLWFPGSWSPIRSRLWHAMVRWNRTCKDQTTGKAAVLSPKKEKNAPQYRRESSFGYTITSWTIFCDWLGNRLIKLQLKPHFHLSRVLEENFGRQNSCWRACSTSSWLSESVFTFSEGEVPEELR